MIKPLLRYVGSKQWFISENATLFPSDIENYFEPFLGSASIFIYLKSNNLIKKQSYLSDVNQKLVDLYIKVKNDPISIFEQVCELKQEKKQYYEVRSIFNAKSQNDLAKYFLYLNRMSYGGIYRVNKKGEYNVPYGNRIYRNLVDCGNLLELSKLFNSKTKLVHSDFKNLKYTLKNNDFICLDPPYMDTATKFNRYDAQRFNGKDASHLYDLIIRASKNGAKFLVFVGGNIEYAHSLKDFGDIMLLSRRNNLSNIDKSKIREEIIVKNY